MLLIAPSFAAARTGWQSARFLGRDLLKFATSVGYGSAPSDPRHTNLIGNRVNRKPEKIRKIEKVRFNLSISIHSDSRHSFPANGQPAGGDNCLEPTFLHDTRCESRQSFLLEKNVPLLTRATYRVKSAKRSAEGPRGPRGRFSPPVTPSMLGETCTPISPWNKASVCLLRS